MKKKLDTLEPDIDTPDLDTAGTVTIENTGGALGAVPELRLAAWPVGERRSFDRMVAGKIMFALEKRGLRIVKEE